MPHQAMSPEPRIVLRVPKNDGRLEWRAFEEPLEILQARTAEDVMPLLEAVERANKEGLWAAGFLSYEAAPAFDSAYVTSSPGELPLAWFALFDRWRPYEPESTPASALSLSDWRPSTSAGDYERAVESIRRWIAAGDTYQVNYTIRLRADFTGDAWGLFTSLAQTQRAPRSAFVDTGDRWAVCSSSPELFFQLEGGRIVCRPMKGTAPRGRYPEEDRRQGEWLQQSAKNRAENLMIVDMVRNDLGRIAQPGTVEVTSLFELERYPSIHQLTSTVQARTEATLPELLTALFPCASITGAPRVRTMELIHRLEAAASGRLHRCHRLRRPGSPDPLQRRHPHRPDRPTNRGRRIRNRWRHRLGLGGSRRVPRVQNQGPGADPGRARVLAAGNDVVGAGERVLSCSIDTSSVSAPRRSTSTVR